MRFSARCDPTRVVHSNSLPWPHDLPGRHHPHLGGRLSAPLTCRGQVIDRPKTAPSTQGPYAENMNAAMTAKSRNSKKDEWRMLIGTFILAFGELEHFALVLWQRYFPSKDPPKGFRQRTEKVLGKVKADPAVS